MKHALIGIAVVLALSVMPLWLVIDLWQVIQAITIDMARFQIGIFMVGCAVGFILLAVYEFPAWLRKKLKTWF